VNELSKVAALPGLRWISQPAPAQVQEADLRGYLESQRLALRAVREVAGLVREGWTESQTADLIDTYLQDYGVRSFFHRAFVWFGERTRFDGIQNYRDFAPSQRVALDGQPFILDVAPIFQGYPCDVGYTRVLGENPRVETALEFLAELRKEIPNLVTDASSGGEFCKRVEDRIREAGYDTVHHRYPFSVLGHRIHPVKIETQGVSLLGFGWQSYWQFLSRGLFGQLLNNKYEGQLDGLWAIEPHVGGPGFGAKFEEILVIEKGRAHWLESEELL